MSMRIAVKFKIFDHLELYRVTVLDIGTLNCTATMA